MELNIWLKGQKVTLYIGGDPAKNKPPVVTATLQDPQIHIEPDRYLIKIEETR